jgi:hypothetical protein
MGMSAEVGPFKFIARGRVAYFFCGGILMIAGFVIGLWALNKWWKK